VTIQAVSWVLSQDAQHLPPKPRLVLLAIANHADHVNGYCWLRLETLADECAIPVRSLFRYIGALVRNGYLRKQLRKGEDGKQRATDYWILFDRAPADWNWAASGDEPEGDEAQDVVEPSATVADGGNDLADGAEAEKVHELADGPSAIVGTGSESADEPSKTNPKKRDGDDRFAQSPRHYKPPPVAAPQPQGALHPDASKPIFVYRGTEAWRAWVAHKKRERGGIEWTLTTTLTIDGERRTGWHFPTLFPPGARAAESTEGASTTGPPAAKSA
jgi:hypothetical protein